MSTPDLHGVCDPAFTAVRDRFAALFTDGPDGIVEHGAAVCVVAGGRTVVDLWAGWADAGRTRPWREDTIVMSASATKGLTAVAALRAVQAGQLALDAPVAAVWPEYATAGKERTTLRHLLTHTAGQPTLATDLGPGGVWDWDRTVAAFADAAPLTPPGAALAYHALSYGHLVGEVVRRATGRTVAAIIHDDLVGPLGAPGRLGVEAGDDRVAELCPPPDGSPFAEMAHLGDGVDVDAIRRYDDPALLSIAVANAPAWRRAGYPGAGGHLSARALGRVYGALANGGALGDVRLLDAALLAEATTEQVAGPDATLGMERRVGLGFWKPSPADPLLGPNDGFGHPGGWGALGWADPVTGIGLGYVTAQAGLLGGDRRGATLVAAARDCA